MAKIKLTKNELKNQRDSLKRYQRYLPTLQLKKQQLQMEVRGVREEMLSLEGDIASLENSWKDTIPLLSGTDAGDTLDLVTVKDWHVGHRNVAGIDVPTFVSITFGVPEYDLFTTPVWYDDIVVMAQKRIELSLRQRLLSEMQELLEKELRVVTQRVNLFEKVKIPECLANIRKIRISMGDESTAAVVRSKIAKRKMQEDAA